MPTANERRALWFLALVALSGTVVRLVRARAPAAAPTADAGLDRQLHRVYSVRSSRPPGGSKGAGARAPKAASREPKAASADPVDMDRATAAEIEALPGIGPSLAAEIVAQRDSSGPFGTVEAFCRVRGIGPAMVARLRSRMVFSGNSAASGRCESEPPRTSKTHITKPRKPR